MKVTGMYPISGLISENAHPEIFNTYDLLELALIINKPNSAEIIFSATLDNLPEESDIRDSLFNKNTGEIYDLEEVNRIVQDTMPILQDIFNRLNHCSEGLLWDAHVRDHDVTIDDISSGVVVLIIDTDKVESNNLENWSVTRPSDMVKRNTTQVGQYRFSTNMPHNVPVMDWDLDSIRQPRTVSGNRD